MAGFSPATRAWFESSFPGPTEAQALGWPVIARGEHTLVHAPTGSGKTLAAFLWTLDRLLHEPVPEAAERCRVLYVSPLKALAYDVERNLRAPLVGIGHAATRLGLPPPAQVIAGIRTGDTPPDERRRMQRHPPDILITTPESLFLILTSATRSILETVRWVIVDEVHAVAGTKRGAHLSLSLERLEELTRVAPQRLGLSATQRPLDTIARFLGGGEERGGDWVPRPVRVVDVPGEHDLEVELVVPVEDMTAPLRPEPAVTVRPDGFVDPPDPRLPVSRPSVWEAIYPRVLELIRRHHSTIVFANSRRLAERICSELNALAGEELARAHHGSVSREQRVAIEEGLKRGDLRAVVATSSLELGIDMGAVDLVIQVESPTSVASGLQRVGRAGHQVGAVSRAKVFPKFRGDLLEATVVVNRMVDRAVESTRIPRNPLDVLAQQVVSMVSVEPWNAADLLAVVRRSASYADLATGPFEATLDMLAGRYPSDLFAELRARITWDRVEGTITPRPGARQLAVANAGTIPDRGLFRVTLPDGARVGELDEEMVYESRPGDVFLLGASSWRIVDIQHDRVEVVPEPGAPAANMPFWHGDAPGRPLETGRAIGEFIRRVAALPPSEAEATLSDRYRLDPLAASNLVAYLTEEKEAVGVVPTDRTVVVERFRDEIGDWRLVVLSPLGARVHAPWAMALVRRFRERYGHDVDVIWSDDGMVFRFPDTDDVASAEEVAIDPEEAEALLMEQLADTALFAARFREAASRALLLPRRRPGSRTPLWQQRRRAADLLAVARQFGSFPIVLETYREVLQDDFDLPALREILGGIQSRRIRIAEVVTSSPSPFAASLLFDFVAAYLYEGDTPLAERRAAALTLDRDLLAELLGEGELRQLLDPDVVADVELELQALTDDRRVRGIDGVHDLLLRLGPLSVEGVAARLSDGDAVALLDQLAAARRALPVRIAGAATWAAIEDSSRLRDALGVQPPPGVPFTFLEPVPDPMGDVVGRFARTHGPFPESAAAAALGLAPAVVRGALERLEAQGRVVRGAFRPGGDEVEWVDVEVLRRLKRRSLAVLRKEIEPVAPDALGRFLPTWHGVGSSPHDRPGLSDVVRQLQGAAIPASALETDVLPTRLDYRPEDLDRLMVSGDLVWVGTGSIGPKDGRVALFFADQLALLRGAVAEPVEGKVHDALRGHLAERGASFFRELYQAAGGGDPDAVVEALWDLVWSGEVTNDSLAPLRALIGGRRSARRSAGKRPGQLVTSPPSASGRWYLVSELIGAGADPTESATAWAFQLLDRHGVLTRAAVAAERLPGGFSGLYPVLSRLEETGRVRRGYFVEGLGGAQFAMPGAVDRLRSPDDGGVAVLAATDPANPYGAALPWPESELSQPSRAAGASVVLLGGALAAFVERGGRRVVTYGDALEQVAAALADLGRRRHRLLLTTVDGKPAAETSLGDALRAAGFATALRGLAWRG
jgi:ATP-dependent helicase Lhr and Lhr-like helicase